MSVARVTREVLRERPHQLRSLSEGVASYRALARSLAPEVERRLGRGVSEDAVVSALRRTGGGEGPDREVLGGSRLTVRKGIGVLTVTAGLSVASDIVRTARSVSKPELLRVIQGERKTTIVAHEDDLDTVEEALDRPPVFRESGLAEVVVTSPANIEREPGVVAEMASRLAVRGINVLEMMSCNTDTIFVVEGRDAGEASEALEFF
ncbi:MAG: hypothetical protein MAG715_00480 [Methanonatronarchaeales archaeon]|nr:hypothetical protein [Methanonatronarchaeales archaeon]